MQHTTTLREAPLPALQKQQQKKRVGERGGGALKAAKGEPEPSPGGEGGGEVWSERRTDTTDKAGICRDGE